MRVASVRGVNETRYREAELRLWKSFGLAPTDRQLLLARCDTSIRVQDVGTGPPVILIHGVSNSGTSWAPLVAGLGEYRCVIVDRPGCGLSEPLIDPFENVGGLKRSPMGLSPMSSTRSNWTGPTS